MYYTISLLTILLSASVQNAKSRYISLSLNISVKMDNDRQKQQQQPIDQQQEQLLTALSATVLRSRLRETLLNMAELSGFRLTLLSADASLFNLFDEQATERPNLEEAIEKNSLLDDIEFYEINYESIIEHNHSELNNIIAENEDYTPNKTADGSSVGLQHLTNCLNDKSTSALYEEEDLFQKLMAIITRESNVSSECINLKKCKNCKSSYEKRLCYERLEALEAIDFLRYILGYYGELTDRESMAEHEEQTLEIETTQMTVMEEEKATDEYHNSSNYQEQSENSNDEFDNAK